MRFIFLFLIIFMSTKAYSDFFIVKNKTAFIRDEPSFKSKIIGKIKKGKKISGQSNNKGWVKLEKPEEGYVFLSLLDNVSSSIKETPSFLLKEESDQKTEITEAMMNSELELPKIAAISFNQLKIYYNLENVNFNSGIFWQSLIFSEDSKVYYQEKMLELKKSISKDLLFLNKEKDQIDVFVKMLELIDEEKRLPNLLFVSEKDNNKTWYYYEDFKLKTFNSIKKLESLEESFSKSLGYNAIVYYISSNVKEMKNFLNDDNIKKQLANLNPPLVLKNNDLKGFLIIKSDKKIIQEAVRGLVFSEKDLTNTYFPELNVGAEIIPFFIYENVGIFEIDFENSDANWDKVSVGSRVLLQNNL